MSHIGCGHPSLFVHAEKNLCPKRDPRDPHELGSAQTDKGQGMLPAASRRMASCTISVHAPSQFMSTMRLV